MGRDVGLPQSRRQTRALHRAALLERRQAAAGTQPPAYRLTLALLAYEPRSPVGAGGGGGTGCGSGAGWTTGAGRGGGRTGGGAAAGCGPAPPKRKRMPPEMTDSSKRTTIGK